MIDLLARVLNAAGMSLTADDLADALWLLAARGVHIDQDDRGRSQLNDRDQAGQTPGPASINHKTDRHPPISPRHSPRAPATPLYLDDAQPARSTVAARAIKLRRRGSLIDPLNIARAFRPFKQVWEPGPPALDLDATVEATAEARHLVVVSRPEPQRRLDVVVVVDSSTSVSLWKEAVDQLETILAQVGAFRSVSRWELLADATSPDGADRPVLVRAATGAVHSADHLIDPTGRRLVLLATDAVGPHWYQQRYWATVERWANTMPVAMIQLLPERYWPNTAIGDDIVAARAPWPASPNHLLDVERPWWTDGDTRKPLAVPVVPLTSRRLAAWANAAVSGIGWVPAAQTGERPDPPDVANAEVSPRARVLAFRSRASRDAQRLAEILAMAPLLSMPLIRLLQASMLPDTGVIELAEVFVGGLLETDRSPGATTGGYYRFHTGVAELLQRGATSTQQWQAYDAVTAYLDEVGATAQHAFHALVPDSEGRATLSPELRPFAELRSSLVTHPNGPASTPTESTQPTPAASTPEPARGESQGGAGSPETTTVDAQFEHHQYTRPMPVWPMLVGQPPALASAFQPRRGLRELVLTARDHGDDVVLTQRPDTTAPAGGGTQVLAGMGGVGKSQLASWFTHQAVKQGTELVVWVAASSPEEIIETYARAAVRVGAAGADGTDATRDAAAFVEWLGTTSRSWLIVLDNITEPEHLSGWWPPHRPAGWTLATTRRREAVLSGAGRRQIPVDVYTPDEAAAYLTERLTDAGHPDLLDGSVGEMAAAVGYLPLALSHTTAYMINEEVGCATYLALYKAGVERLGEGPSSADTDSYGRPVAVTLLLALDAADATAPVGLARPALTLAALLDPDGHPDTLWATPAVLDYLAAHRTDGTRRRLFRQGRTGQPVTASQARQALRLLHRYGLLTHTPTAGARAVRIHVLTARAARETTPAPATAVRTVADALLALWPEFDHATTDLLTALRANTITLTSLAGDLLWQPGGHPLLYRAGLSLLRAGLHTTAVTSWQHLADQAARLLGEEHPDTLTARANLALSYGQAGRTAEAISLLERVVTDRERLLGEEHPDTLVVRNNLAHSYQQAGRTAEAITIVERVVADFSRLLGEEHPHTLTARANLALSYGQAGRTAEAITIEERVATDAARLLGQDHPDTLTARNNLAHSYQQAGRTAEAITIVERVAADRERLLGQDHPDTLTARANLAASYREAGRTAEAISILERVAADAARLLGQDHPDTLTARANLALSYGRAGRTAEAISILERVAADAARLLGQDHPDTLTARANLALSYGRAGRTAEAITILEPVATDAARLLGEDHPTTVAVAGALRVWRAEA